ncbi:hypothetical protein BH24ACI2_BH24ACI2_13670 [soil metagenome]|jgi:hypothetical protein
MSESEVSDATNLTIDELHSASFAKIMEIGNMSNCLTVIETIIFSKKSICRYKTDALVNCC